MSADRRGTSARRLPSPGRPVPVSTYRLQLGADLTFDDVAARVGYYADLGVTHLYLSPVLRAAPGSTHGYDVVDHSQVSPVLGGRAGLDRLADAAHAAGLGLVLDIVPNHMAVPVPAWHNRPLWSVLEQGPDSPYARWFDVDWSLGEGALLMPVLGARLGTVLAGGELELDVVDVDGSGPRTVLRYHEHVLPVRAGTESLPLTELLDRQHYRLAYWKVADEELNYRRFFDVDTLVAIRVEDPEVFDATHRLIVELVTSGTVDGLRIDHPDGLADPAGYLARLREATGGAWVVVEKILAGEEELAPDWWCAGTTGYDALWRVQQTFVDPAGAALLGSAMHRLTGDTTDSYVDVVEQAKREVIAGPLYAEVHRLTELAWSICHDDLRLRDHTWRALHECLVELLVALDRYRAYVVPGEPPVAESIELVERAATRARSRLDPERGETMSVVVDLLLGREVGSAGRTRGVRRDELMVRFGQTSGPVQAKGVEDTAFYRWTHLTALCEVGGEPARFAVSPDELLGWAQRTAQDAPLGLVTSATHDTKRGEDTRARIGVLSALPVEWSAVLTELHTTSAPYRSALVDGRIENLLWQTLAGTWTPAGPIDADRLTEYLTKVMREAKSHTTWATPDQAYEGAVLTTARRALDDPAVSAALERWDRLVAEPVRVYTLGQKLVTLTLPGVADTYQGSETLALTLVDPDNRRPVDVVPLAAALAQLDAGSTPRTLVEEKLLVTSRTLRVRRDHAEAFVGPGASIVPLPSSTAHCLAYARTVADEPQVVVLATRLAAGLRRLGGWRAHTIALPRAGWCDVLTGQEVTGGVVPVADLLDRLPVALLVRV